MKKSVMFDVLNVIDKANREKDYDRITFEYSLLKRDTFLRYNNLFELAREFDDSIAAVLYIPENDKNINRLTVLLTVFLDRAKESNPCNDSIARPVCCEAAGRNGAPAGCQIQSCNAAAELQRICEDVCRISDQNP